MVASGGHIVPGDELYRGPGSATVLCVDVVHQCIQGLSATRKAVLSEKFPLLKSNRNETVRINT
jgi:hypothetical protein